MVADDELLARAVTPELLERARRVWTDADEIIADIRATIATSREMIRLCGNHPGSRTRPTTAAIGPATSVRGRGV